VRLIRYNVAMPWDALLPERDPLVQRGMVMLGNAVRRARHRNGWTQRELEARTGIDQSTISKFENGRRLGLRFSRFAMLVAVLGGLDFDPPGEARLEPLLSRGAQIAADEARLQAFIRAQRLADLEDDD
jgi:transcriptional regulator with XRE-family HTH domain